MDRLQRSFFRLAAQVKFGRLRRQEFEAWFCEIMQKAHPSDFETVRLTIGDGGLDGVLISEATVFQVYAPRDQRTDKIVGKIEHDFDAGKTYLSEPGVEMRRWVFVHNDGDGLAAEVVSKLMHLKQGNSTIKIERWAFDMIWWH